MLAHTLQPRSTLTTAASLFFSFSARLSWPNSRTGAHDDVSHYLFLRESGLPIPAELQARVDEIDTITFYVMGKEDTTVGNYWTTLPAWPTKTPRNYYLAPNGRLQTTLPTSATIPPLSYLYVRGRAARGGVLGPRTGKPGPHTRCTQL